MFDIEQAMRHMHEHDGLRTPEQALLTHLALFLASAVRVGVGLPPPAPVPGAVVPAVSPRWAGSRPSPDAFHLLGGASARRSS